MLLVPTQLVSSLLIQPEAFVSDHVFGKVKEALGEIIHVRQELLTEKALTIS